MVHVALRATTQDLNTSTPRLIAEFNENLNSNRQINVCEAGYIAEERIFKGRINWLKSARNGLNLAYCKSFLKNLLENCTFNFDEKQAIVKINENMPTCSAIDFDYITNSHCFE